MRKINLLLQEFLTFALIFMLSFVWLRYFLRNFWLAMGASLLLAGTVYGIMWLIKRKKQEKIGLKIREKEEAENMFLSLACSDSPMDFFARLAAKKHQNVIKHKAYITILHKEENVKTLLYADLSFQGLTVARFMEIYTKIKKEHATKIVICCRAVTDKELPAFCANFKEKFLILDQYQTYEKLYKYYEFFPEITTKLNANKKLAFKDFLAYSFNKKRTKGYLFSALVLIISGLFIPYSIYYSCIASLLVVFALLSQFNPYFNIKTDPEVL